MTDSAGVGPTPPHAVRGGAAAPRGPGPRPAILLVLLGAAGLSFTLMRGVELFGDERFYHAAAGHVARCILGRESLAECIDEVVGYGWFLPGMALLLTPAHLAFGGEAPVAVVRAWMIAVNTGLLALIARELAGSGTSGRRVPWGVVAGFLVPFYACFVGCLWGDLVAVHAAILLMLVLERRIACFGPLLGAACGAAVGCITCCRPQYFLLLGLVSVRAALAFADGMIGGSRRLGGGLLALVAAWCAVIAPWQVALHSRYGPFFLVVSTAERPFATDEHYRAKHGLTGNGWVGAHRALMAEAASNGRNLHEQIRAGVRELATPTFPERVAHQADQARRFYGRENEFLERFQQAGRDGSPSDRTWWLLRGCNAAAWRLWLAAGVLLMLVPFGTGAGLDYRLPVAFKGLAGLIAVQPIVYGANARYHVALIPLISIFACIAVATGTLVPGGGRASRIALRVVQAACLLLVAVTACLLAYQG